MMGEHGVSPAALAARRDSRSGSKDSQLNDLEIFQDEPPLQARALYDYCTSFPSFSSFLEQTSCLTNDLLCFFFSDPEQDDEVGLAEGDLVIVYERDQSGWWTGTPGPSSSYGCMPR